MAAPTVTTPWAAHRRRAEVLRDRYPHAAEVLTLYLALLDVWTGAWRAASTDRPAPDELAVWAAARVVPEVVAATVQSGPALLGDAVQRLDTVEPALAAWLAGTELDPIERYLARAALRGPLAAVDANAACAADPAPRGGSRCPSCGGLPQLSLRTDGGEALVSGRRELCCVRCAGTWPYAGNACASCGVTTGAQRTVFAEQHDQPVVGRRVRADPGTPQVGDSAAGRPLFAHLRIEACERCSRYLIDVDLGVDGRGVPEVDELAALPLDLFATERGLEKIAANLMGF